MASPRGKEPHPTKPSGYRRGLFLPAWLGRIIKMMGYGALVEFASVVNVVECAMAIQNAMAERNAASSHEHPIEFRIGVNLGYRSTEFMEAFMQSLNGL
jgi:adenylate cyclase